MKKINENTLIIGSFFIIMLFVIPGVRGLLKGPESDDKSSNNNLDVIILEDTEIYSTEYNYFDLQVCNAYKNKIDKERCFNELMPEFSLENKKLIKEYGYYETFSVIKVAFVGGYKEEEIKTRMDKVMELYDTPRSIENYNRAASVLVEMRRLNGFSEMEILEYMKNIHSAETVLDFGSAAAFSAILMDSP